MFMDFLIKLAAGCAAIGLFALVFFPGASYTFTVCFLLGVLWGSWLLITEEGWGGGRTGRKG
jgi:hypothetical protein